jgi:hypothetical protein
MWWSDSGVRGDEMLRRGKAPAALTACLSRLGGRKRACRFSHASLSFPSQL